MSDHRGFKWSQVKNVRTALRTFHDNRDEGQPRGWERQREDDRPPAKDPPPPSRPAYSYSQHYQSDPGLHSGFGPGYNSPPLPAQGSPPLLHNQHYQGQYQAGPCLQGYGAPPQPNQYHPTHPQAYGQNQGYINPLPPASHTPHYPPYQQQPMSSADQRYQSGQGAYPYPYGQTTYQPAGNSYSPPLPPRPNGQDTLGSSQHPSFTGPSYPPQSNGGSLSRTLTAPAASYCKHNYLGEGLEVATCLLWCTADWFADVVTASASVNVGVEGDLPIPSKTLA